MATIVSCYYKLKSKHSLDSYKIWINNFLSNITCNIIIFTSADLLDYFNSFNNIYIYIIIKEIEDLEIYKEYIDIWDNQWEIDPQKNDRTKYNYIIWNSKLKFLKDAIKVNPFNTDKFIWNDIGVIRNTKFYNILKYYPDHNQISTDKIDIVLINNFTKNKKFFQNEIHFSGAIFGSDINTLLKYHDLYYNKFDEYLQNGKFIGCDQQIISSIYFENIKLFNVIKTDDWFHLINYYSNIKHVIFMSNGRLGNAIFRYFACALICIKNNYKYILDLDFINYEKYTFYRNQDFINADILHVPNSDINKLSIICDATENAVCFNTIGYIKSDYDIKKLETNQYINHSNRGLYVKNIVSINDTNYHKYYDCMTFNNVLMNQFYQFDEIFLQNKDSIINFIENNKDNHYITIHKTQKILMRDIIDNISLPSDKIYDIVIHIRLGDFNEHEDFIDYKYLLNLFETINFINKKIAIVVEKPKTDNDILYVNNCIKWFNNKNININVESNTLIIDFNIMKQCKILICSMSTLSWSSAYLSKNIELCYMPNYNFNGIRPKTNFKNPIKNTILYDVKTTQFTDIKIIILTLKEFPERMENINKLLINISGLGIKYEIVYGICGSNIKIYNTEKNNIKLLYNNFETYYYDNTKRSFNQIMRKGELGCAWSHLNIYKKLLNDDTYNKYLIFEDDATLFASLNDVYNTLNNLPENFDLCHIGLIDSHKITYSNKINEYFYTIIKQYFNRTTSYIISKNGASKLINYSNNYINLPSDDLISDIFIKTIDFNFYVSFKYLFKEGNNTKSVINKII
jgi:glycosyl transferase, family 25